MKKFYKIVLLLIVLIFISTFNPKTYDVTLKKNEALFIPKGYAHGYKCKGQKNILIYLLTKSYNAKNNKGIFWNDSSLNIKWRIRNPIVSKRDLNLPKLR